jgi:cellulose synthase/poly-beta-1,6-N-acetylglucosamine synthase-like glycosyltransferase
MARNNPMGCMRCSVIIPTYSRADALRRCLAAVARQSRPADEVLVVTRQGDEATARVIGEWSRELPLRALVIREPGLVAASNLGLMEAQGDVLAFVDDDTEPWRDWLERIERHFRDLPDLGALGGRDWLYADGVLREGQAETVGRVQWHGRRVGNHHLGVGPAREVEIIKGANMAYRRAAIAGLRFDRRLKGGDAEWCLEPAFVFAVRRRGWKIVYDPSVAVDHHHPAPRLALDDSLSTARTYNRVFNETLVLLEYLPAHRRAVFVVWGFLVGTRDAPGLAQWLRFLWWRRPAATQRLLSAWRARLDALRTYDAGSAAEPGSA